MGDDGFQTPRKVRHVLPAPDNGIAGENDMMRRLTQRNLPAHADLPCRSL